MYILLAFCLAAIAHSKAAAWLLAPDSAPVHARHHETDGILSLMQTSININHGHDTISNIQHTSSVQGLGRRQEPVEMPWVVPPNNPRDWLFGVRTVECKPTVVFDNSSTSIISRTFIPMLMLLTVGMIVRLATLNALESIASDSKADDSKAAEHRQEPAGDPESNTASASQTEPASNKPAERLWHVDFARISAVVCVIFEHCGGMGYSRRNMGWGLYWTMPYLFMTCGVSIMFSKSSMAGYILRLACVFVVGVGANWTADVITHRDWQHDFANTIFQMMFVVMLIGMALLTEPLRQALHFRKSNPAAKARKGMILATIIWGFLTVIGFVRFIEATPLLPFELGGNFGAYYSTLTQELPLFLIEFCGFVFLCHLLCVLGPGQHSGLVGWLLLPFLYLPGIVVPWHEDCFARWLNLYIFAMVCTVWPLKGQEQLRAAVSAYWPFVIMALCLIAMPDMAGRCDMFPPGTLWERARERTGEIIMTVSFVTAAMQVSDPWNVTVWLGRWSLFAYCFHLCFYRILGSPYGPLTTFSFIPVFYLLHVMCSKPPGEKASAKAVS